MTLFAATLLAIQLLPAAALRPPPVPMPGPAPATSPSGPSAVASVDARRLPIAQRRRYELFSQKCGRCHGLERSLEAGYGADQWDDYLKKKYRRAGAGISPEQSEEIGAFLRYWSGRK
jgi:mono/diheme cytochrome c family protein